MRYRWIAAVLLVGAVVTFGTGVAHAAGATVTLSISPSSGLTNGQSVTITATGLAANSPGTILECDDAPSGVNETSVDLAQPVGQAVSLGCTAPSFSHVASTKADGSFSATFSIVQGTLGPPCGPSPDIAPCPATDSAGNPPSADAPNFPCPPTAAQAAQGYVCHLNFGDQAGDSASGAITFAGQSATATTAPTATSSPGGAGTTTGSSATTVAPATGASSSTGSGGTPAGPSQASASAPPAASSSGTLASTGPPSWLWSVLAAGLGSLGLGALLWLSPGLVWRRRVTPDGGAQVWYSPQGETHVSDLWVRHP